MNNIDEKLNELIDLLKDQEEVILYNSIEQNLNNNNYINDKINEFRKMQQKMVLYESKNNEVPEVTQKRYDRLYEELLDIPLFNEYLNLQDEINDLIQQITDIIETEINITIE